MRPLLATLPPLACLQDSEIPDPALPPIVSLVPGGPPLDLCAYYPSFTDYYPEAEMQTKRWVTRHVQSDWVICDIGANVGLYSMLFARHTPQGRVHAF